MEIARILLTLGGLLIVGLLTDALGSRSRLPRVTLLLVFGFLAGPGCLALLPRESLEWFPVVSSMALLMIGFLLGEKLAVRSLRRRGRAILWISVVVVLTTAVAVFGGLLLFGAPLVLALLLAGVATSTDPAATVDVVHEQRAHGPFTATLLGVVAIDDAWGLIAFSLLLASAQALTGGPAPAVLGSAAWEIGGALMVGGLLGVPMAYCTGRIRPGEPTLSEALGLVFLCGGLALWLEVSFLLAAMTMGVVVANLARHHERPFHSIENVEWPFMILFFVLAGASLDVETIGRIGLLGAAYMILRVAGRLVGAWLGAHAADSPAPVRHWIGPALMPQAGVALGMALVAAQRFPEHADTVLGVAIGASVLFEIAGPVATRWALLRSGAA